jgi:hypothetical protein
MISNLSQVAAHASTVPMPEMLVVLAIAAAASRRSSRRDDGVFG